MFIGQAKHRLQEKQDPGSDLLEFAMRDPTVSIQDAVIQHLLLFIYYDKNLIHIHSFEVLSFYTSY